MMKEFRQLEFSKKLKKASEARSKGYEDKIVKNDDIVYYQNQDKKAWLGLVRVFAVNGRVSQLVLCSNYIGKIQRRIF